MVLNRILTWARFGTAFGTRSRSRTWSRTGTRARWTRLWSRSGTRHRSRARFRAWAWPWTWTWASWSRTRPWSWFRTGPGPVESKNDSKGCTNRYENADNYLELPECDDFEADLDREPDRDLEVALEPLLDVCLDRGDWGVSLSLVLSIKRKITIISLYY